MRHIMKISSNGRISLPADVRKRWKADEVVMVDMGDQVVMRPRSSDPVAALVGKDKGRGPSSDELRNAGREDEAARERRGYE
jgi:bifunctional DNA-binding transcriptional regulator/antitoxin component of YhaV-PrlF toxin-antitoxin module